MADTFSVVIDRSGFDLTPWVTGYSFSHSFESASQGFSCSISPRENIPQLRAETKPFLPILFFINGKQQFRGQIEQTVTSDDGSMELTCSDYLANAADCSAGKNIVVPKGDTLASAITKVMQSQMITNVVAGWDTTRNTMLGGPAYTGGPAIDYTARKVSEPVTVKRGEGIWEAVELMCRKHRCIPKAGLSHDTIHLCAPEYRQSASYRLIRQLKNQGNNFRGNVSRNWRNVPTILIATGSAGTSSENKKGLYVQRDPFQDKFGTSPEALAIGKDGDRQNVYLGRFEYMPGSTPNNLIYREMRIEDREARSLEELEAKADRALAEALKDTLVIDGEIDGHTRDGLILTPDTLVSVTDEVGGVFQDMWLSSVSHTNVGGSQKTNFTAISPSTYIL